MSDHTRMRTLVIGIETARREAEMTHEYGPFDEKVSQFYQLAFQDEHDITYAMRAEVCYNIAKANVDQGTVAQSSIKAHALFLLALRYVDDSADNALAANDTTGIAYAFMMKGGHVLPALGRYDEAGKLLKLTVDDADHLLTLIDEGERKRLHNAAMNCRAHLIRLHVKHGQHFWPLQELAARFKEDLIALKFENEQWALDVLEMARGYAP